MNSLKDTLIYKLSLGLLILIILFLCFIFYLLFAPFKEPTITPYPMPILNKGKIVHYGEPIVTKVRSCTFSATPTTVSVKYENKEGRVFYFASHDSVGVVGCRDSQQNRTPIPESLPPGKYKIYITAVFHVSFFKDVTKVYETESFLLEASPSAEVKK